ncbi:MAG: hypothetical protein KDC87_09775, partial [Planctomycetes bacterium]|nr:hypothetical protein [Planctomycetota bacterium]
MSDAAPTPLLPAGLEEALREAVAAATVTIYLSDPTAAFDRSSYVMLGHAGVRADYVARMRGPLKPDSIDRFSASDRRPERVVPDVATESDFQESSFVAAHGIRSLFRLSVRIRRGGRAAWDSVPILLEVFASYREPRGAAELRQLARKARKMLDESMAEVREHLARSALLNPRAAAQRFRRLDRLAQRLAGVSDPYAPGPGPSERDDSESDSPSHERPAAAAYAQAKRRWWASRWWVGFRELANYVLDCLELPQRSTEVSFHYCHAWGAEDLELIPFFVHPEPRTRRLRGPLVRNAAAPILREVAASGTSFVFDELDSQPEAVRRLYGDAPRPGSAITVPLFAGPHANCVLHVTSAGRVRRDSALATLWRTLPLIERILGDILAHRALQDGILARLATQTLGTMTLSPRDLAIEHRLEFLRRHLDADETHYAELDDGTREQRVWDGGVGVPPATPELPVLRSLFEGEPQLRVVSIDRGPDGGAVRGYRVTAGSQAFQVVRRTLAGEQIERLGCGGLAHSVPSTEVILPVWRQQAHSPGARSVRGVLRAVFHGQRWVPAPLHVETLDLLCRTFSAAALSIERFAN